MRIQWNGRFGSRFNLGQGEADDRGGTPNVPTVMDAIYHFFFIDNYQLNVIFMAHYDSLK